MKTKITIIFCLLSIWGYSQQYKSILENGNAKWSYFITGCDFADSYELISTKDTIINQLHYKKIYSYSDFQPIDTNITVNEQWQFHKPQSLQNDLQSANIHIRESADLSKVYLLDTEKNEEYLISDISLQKGDTFYIPKNADFGREYVSMPFDIVDSVYYKNGLKVVQLSNIMFNLGGLKDRLKFIEGIGPNAGLYTCMLNGWCHDIMLNCFTNDLLFYKNELLSFWDCGRGFVNGLVKMDLDTFDVKKLEDRITLTFENDAKRDFTLYNLTGNKILHASSKFDTQFEIPIKTLIAGIYFLRIYNYETKRNQSLKIIL